MSTRPPALLSRRDALVGLGSSALLAACADPIGTKTTEADALAAADATADAATAGTDAAAEVASDVTAATADATTTPVGIAPITPNASFYVTSCCTTPTVDLASWTLTISDRGKLLATLDMAFLESLKPRTKEHTLECIGGGPAYQLISNAIWTGLPLLEIFAAKGIQVPSDVSEMKIVGLDEFGTGLPTAELALPIWLVWRVNGDPLPPTHGYPARLLVPNRYGMKNPKWVKAIEFVAQPFIGYWESKGWSQTAFYRPNAYIRSPKGADTLTAGKTTVYGTAFAGRDAIVKVEVRIDGGAWQSATLDYSGIQDVWTLWHLDWQATVGTHTIQAHCTTASGATSTENPEGTDPLSGFDGSMAISVTIA